MEKTRKDGNVSAWNIKTERFPMKGKLESKIKYIVGWAILAPSGHNSQPWKYKIEDGVVKILPDYSRSRMVVDPQYRELFISLGAAGKNLEIAANHFGMIYEKNISKESIDYRFKEGKKMTDGGGMLEMITKRRTNRGEFWEKAVEKEKLDKLAEVKNDRAWIEIYQNTRDKQNLAKLIHDADLVWFKSKELMEELRGWLRDDTEMSKDGLPTGVLNLYKMATEVKYLFMGDGKAAKERAERDRLSAIKSPALAVIVSKTDTAEDWIKAGEVYQEMALKLTKMGLGNGFYNTVVELNGQRRKMGEILGIKGKVQLVVRIGYAKKGVKPSPRRPVKEVLIEN